MSMIYLHSRHNLLACMTSGYPRYESNSCFLVFWMWPLVPLPLILNVVCLHIKILQDYYIESQIYFPGDLWPRVNMSAGSNIAFNQMFMLQTKPAHFWHFELTAIPKTPPNSAADLLYRRLRKITDWSLLIGFIDRFLGSERAASGAGWSFLCAIGLSQPETGRLSLPAAHHICSCIQQNAPNVEMCRMNTFGRLQTGISHVKLPCWRKFLPVSPSLSLSQ